MPGMDARRIRKRETDRKSQKEHRERQKQYIRQLEDTVRTLRLAHSGDERVAQLLEERDALQRRCDDLTSRLNRVRNIVTADAPGLGGVSHHPGQDDSDSPPGAAAAATEDTSSTPTDGYLGHATLDERSLSAPGRGGVQLAALLDDAIDVFSMSADVDPFPPDLGGALQHVSSHAAGTSAPQGMMGLQAPLLALEKSSNMIPTPPGLLSGPLVALSCIPPSEYLSLPPYARPVGVADHRIVSMVEEACREHEANSFDTSEPSLRRLLLDKPDILAFRLYHYITLHGPMPLHLLLAVFWVQYLILRWHVTRSQEDYMRIPIFARPTPLERQIPHRICIDMLIWPDIRQAVIRDAPSVDPEQVGIDLLSNLDSNWQPRFETSGSLIGSLDILEIMERQALCWSFWKVGRGFRDKYPQYSSCRLSTLADDGTCGSGSSGGNGISGSSSGGMAWPVTELVV